MHLVTFWKADKPALGVLPDGEYSTDVIDVSAIDDGLPSDVVGVLRAGVEGTEALAAAVRRADGRATSRLDDVVLLAPIPSPGKIIGIGLNYRDHAQETGQPIPEYPTVFAKFPTSVCAPGADIVYPTGSARVDYEGELGVVIGRRCRNVPEAQASTVIGGYLNVNDVSARDVQGRNSQWTLGKSFDTFAPIGPALVTAADVPEAQSLDLVVTVNGDERQRSNTKNMIFSINRLVAELSAVCTLEPGDIIATGTPGGVGIGFSPERLLGVGDEVTVHVDGLGILRNRVAAAVPDRSDVR